MFLSLLFLLKNLLFISFQITQMQEIIIDTKLIGNTLKLHQDDKIEENGLKDTPD